MARVPKISESEWEVMNVLWERPGLTAALVYERLEEQGWKLNTVRTFLTRLEAKKAVKSSAGAEARVFSPTVTREACLRGEGESFANRFFKGATGALLLHFAESTKLSDKELAELEEIIRQKKKGGRRGSK